MKTGELIETGCAICGAVCQATVVLLCLAMPLAVIALV